MLIEKLPNHFSFVKRIRLREFERTEHRQPEDFAPQARGSSRCTPQSNKNDQTALKNRKRFRETPHATMNVHKTKRKQ